MMRCHCSQDVGSAKGPRLSRSVAAIVVGMTIGWAGGAGMAHAQVRNGPPGAGASRPVASAAPSSVPKGPPPESKPAPNARAAAPFDPTGHWVSLVTRDWQFRMVVPGRGEYQGIPLNLAGKQHADAWDPKSDEKLGRQCAPYGAGVVMLVPERLRIEWSDDDTLRVETDAGTQTRLLRFRPGADAATAPASWQGQSRASWLMHAASDSGFGPPADEGNFGSLKIVTTNMLAGLIRKNGIAYSEQSDLTEYWDVQQDPVTKKEYLIVTASLHDPVLLRANFNYVATFERESDGSKWDPTPCSLTSAP